MIELAKKPLSVPSAIAPILKYPGGKRLVVPEIAKYFEPYRDRCLVELFCGSAAVALGLQPKSALLNDINPYVINLHRQLKIGLGRYSGVQWVNDPSIYYAQREWFNYAKDEGGAIAANLLYYLNRTGFNGLMRFNQSGEFNVPFGRYKTISYCTDFSPWKSAYQSFGLNTSDFEKVAIASTDFVYADPPYDGNFTTYAGNKFTWTEQVRLAEFLAFLPCPVLVSNAATDRIVSLYRDLRFQIEFIDVTRRIACNGDRTSAKEVLMFKEPK